NLIERKGISDSNCQQWCYDVPATAIKIAPVVVLVLNSAYFSFPSCLQHIIDIWYYLKNQIILWNLKLQIVHL
ncbi:hypothetical protein, partial [Ethanoligenens sp.]|uniref:hypothetical protein n=1 Tax=Ethanoligenens sp. TaxID=2099655 RepID=UPI0039EC5664